MPDNFYGLWKQRQHILMRVRAEQMSLHMIGMPPAIEYERDPGGKVSSKGEKDHMLTAILTMEETRQEIEHLTMRAHAIKEAMIKRIDESIYSNRYKQTAILYYIEGFTLMQVADAMHYSLPNIKRAKRRIDNILEIKP